MAGDVWGWPDDDEGGGEPHRAARAAGLTSGAAGSSKHPADAGALGTRPGKRPKQSAAATKRQETLKAAAFKKIPKPRPMVSA